MKTFHPIHSRDRYRNWHPANEAASILVHLIHTWDDIVCLWKIRSERNNEYEQKLLFRYCLIEVKSLLDLLDRLQPLIMNAPVYSKNEEPKWRGLFIEEKEKSKILFKNHHAARKAIYDDLADIRNKISAHRDVDSWSRIMESWDKLEPTRFQSLFDTIPPLFNFIKTLDIYDWSAELKEGIFAAIGPRINPNDWAN